MDRSLILASKYNQKNLLKEIFSQDLPEKFVQEIPAQTLYLTIKQNGLPDSAELIDICSIEQIRLFLDLDCWRGDEFDEEKFWAWLELPDASSDEVNHEILKKILNAFDLKLLGNLLCRYVNIVFYDESTDEPPAGDYFTPDKGSTWINVFIPDPHRNFLLNRFLAALFELSTEVFYQLLAVPSIATPSQLQEESYQDRKKRLEAEGFPSHERSLELTTPVKLSKLKTKLDEQQKTTKSKQFNESTAIELSSKESLLPLELLWNSNISEEELNSEFNLILNATLIRWKIPLDEHEQILFIAKQVRGAINIGLEIVIQELELSAFAAYHNFFLQDLYRLGLSKLSELKESAKKFSPEQLKKISLEDSELFEIIAGILENIPQKASSEMIKEERVTDYLPFEYLADVNATQELLNQ